jgi:hypothetical protein
MAKLTAALGLALLVAAPAAVISQGGAEYVGLDTCAACHADIADSYAKTPHAKSLEVLKAAGSDTNPECLACHTTGLAGSKYVDGAVTCEACHGAGSEHVATGDTAAVKKAVGEDTCVKCHTADWSPNFDYETYRAKGLHS